MLERAVENYLISQCKKHGIETRKVGWIGRRHAPDELLFTAGGIWVETKRPGEDARAGQEREHKRMRAAGMDVRLIDTKDGVDELIAELKQRGYIRTKKTARANNKSHTR